MLSKISKYVESTENYLKFHIKNLIGKFISGNKYFYDDYQDKRLVGKKTAMMYNDKDVDGPTGTWQALPAMRIGRASHSCSVTTVDGALGIIVAGGSNDGDSVEFFDWEEKKKWAKMPRMSSMRRIGPGMAFVRGKLTMVIL